MAVSEKVLKRALNINVVSGVDDSGEAKTKARSYNNINPEATLDQLHAAGQALGELMTEDVDSICYTEKKELNAVA